MILLLVGFVLVLLSFVGIVAAGGLKCEGCEGKDSGQPASAGAVADQPATPVRVAPSGGDSGCLVAARSHHRLLHCYTGIVYDGAQCSCGIEPVRRCTCGRGLDLPGGVHVPGCQAFIAER